MKIRKNTYLVTLLFYLLITNNSCKKEEKISVEGDRYFIVNKTNYKLKCIYYGYYMGNYYNNAILLFPSEKDKILNFFAYYSILDSVKFFKDNDTTLYIGFYYNNNPYNYNYDLFNLNNYIKNDNIYIKRHFRIKV